MNITLVAKRYARALFEIGEAEANLQSINQDINVITKLFTEAPLIRDYCFRNKKNKNDDLEFINTAFIPYVSPTTQKLIYIMTKNDRLSSLPYLPQAYEEILEKNENRVTVDIESAQKLSETELSTIQQKMKKKLGNEIKLRSRIIPDLLGGFRIIWQNKVLDYSAKERLNQIRQEILDKSY